MATLNKMILLSTKTKSSVYTSKYRNLLRFHILEMI